MPQVYCVTSDTSIKIYMYYYNCYKNNLDKPWQIFRSCPPIIAKEDNFAKLVNGIVDTCISYYLPHQICVRCDAILALLQVTCSARCALTLDVSKVQRSPSKDSSTGSPSWFSRTLTTAAQPVEVSIASACVSMACLNSKACWVHIPY